jgi:hypothetical protein
VRPPEPGDLCRGPGPRGHKGHSGRQDYPNNPPPTWATVISEMGPDLPPALQKQIVSGPCARSAAINLRPFRFGFCDKPSCYGYNCPGAELASADGSWMGRE